MKHVLILLVCMINMNQLNGQSFNILTYNIRYDSPNDGENRWDFRKQFLTNQLKFHSPDIFGIQEGLHHQVQYIDSALSGYTYIGVGRDDGKTEGEYSALYYRKDAFEIVEQSTFWLSETPEVVSVGWDAAMERICTYGLFKHKQSGKHLWVFNTHFDHRGETAREESVELILKMINNLNVQNYPVIVTGDFNLEPDHQSINSLRKELKDAHDVCNYVCFGPEGTYNGFKFCEPVKRRIDYIFVSDELKVQKYAVLSDSWDMKYPSDHLPVIVKMYLLQ